MVKFCEGNNHIECKHSSQTQFILFIFASSIDRLSVEHYGMLVCYCSQLLSTEWIINRCVFVFQNVGKALRATWKCLMLGLYNFALGYSTPITVAATFVPDFHPGRNRTWVEIQASPPVTFIYTYQQIYDHWPKTFDVYNVCVF